MTAKYQTQFEINRTELRVIETALREQAKHLSNEMLNQQASPPQDQTVDADQLNSRMKSIQSVLGNLHNQKTWYRPQDAVSIGG